ncbi:uncharacterized protein I206_107737 [Kwoniella pini CBS 10737]|uniref:Uncharacterized protein n=1 Tax=Kwoniella pini CBS 10737 TaxID=1296096 RepID=A0A1B9HY42_9TREE|nr:uncharacterized protein I206_06071 [Kwoniella pini CBS 10737]OCF48203.1 hypothetical protein I206_06071 [Kwoniella pini CBS 10737]
MGSMSTRVPPPPLHLSSTIDTSLPPISNGVMRTASSSSMRRRSHSSSVSSKLSSVHFNLEDRPNTVSRTPSKSSFKSPQMNGSVMTPLTNNNSYQPIHPSTLHNSTIPSPPKSAPIPSTTSSSSSVTKPFPTTSSGVPSPLGSNRPPLPTNRTSQDRRVWSETLPPNPRHRSGSVIAIGRRASRLTGGFETSSSGSEGESTDKSTKDAGESGTNTPGTMSLSENAIAGPSRARAKSLMGPIARERQNSDASGTSRDVKRKKVNPPKPKRSFSKEPLPSSRMVSYRSNDSPAKNTSALPNSKSDSYFGTQNGNASPKLSRNSTGRSSPLIESTIPGPDKGHLSRGRSLDMLNERSSSPDGNQRSKGKAKETSRKTNDLAASLGLGIGAIQDMTLNPDQLRNLLSDSDVSSALRLMNSPHAPASRPTNMNEWSNSVFFSPPTTPRAENGSTHKSPYLVSAPPALIQSEEGHGRERTTSIASSVAPPMHSTWGSSPRHRQSFDSHPSPDMQALSRRRASSKAGLLADGQSGGHIPFTHHLPVPQVDEGSPDDELDDISENLPAITEQESGSIPMGRPSQPDKSGKEGKEKEKKSRLSNIFHIGSGKKKTTETPTIKHEHHLLHKDHKTDLQKEQEKAREREKYEKDVERRRLEQERRDEELAQERRFKALTQVAAHPSAERRAYTTGAKLRAFYSHVYEGIEDPPKLNPLAVVRWRIKTEEQNQARQRWEREQGDHHSHQSDRSGLNHQTSPYNRSRSNHFGDTLHSSPMSMGSSNGHGIHGPRRSNESHRSTSLGSFKKPNDTTHNKTARFEKGWGFSVDDISRYKIAKGHVNYFIPPKRSHYDVDVMTEDEDEGTPLPFSPQSSASKPNGGDTSRKDDSSSIAASSKKSHLHKMGVKTASNTSLMDVEGVLGEDNLPLSRSTSIETGGKSSVQPKHRLTHRTHQSLSAVGQTSLTYALKQPFEKLSNVAKKQRNPAPSREEGETHHIEDPRLSDRHNIRKEMIPSPHAAPTQQYHTPMSAKPSRTTVNSSMGRTRDNIFRRHGVESFTDEETSKDKEFHLRKLFLKGQKVLSSFDDASYKLYRRSEVSLPASGGKIKQDEREQELLALEAALMRESAFRERQAEAHRKTQAELQAQERIRKLENEIYAERVEHLEVARQKLDNVTANITTVDDTIRQFIFQIDFLRDESSIAANIDVDWSSINPLRDTYGSVSRNKLIEEGEHRDILPPLRSFTTSHDSGSDLAPNRRQRTTLISRKSKIQGGLAGNNNANAPRRKGSLNASLAPIQSSLLHPMRHRPRRMYIDPSGLERVDPVKQAELILSFAKDRMKDMGKEKERSQAEVENLIYKIENMIRTKESVRRWTRQILEKNLNKQSQLDQLIRQEQSNNNLQLQLIMLRDNLINTSFQGAGAFIRTIFWIYYQVKGEVWFFVKWLRPSSYWCSKSIHESSPTSSNDSKYAEHNGDFTNDITTSSQYNRTNEDSPSSPTARSDDLLNNFGSPMSKRKSQRLTNLNYIRTDGEERRIPFLVTCTVLAVSMGIVFYFYGS